MGRHKMKSNLVMLVFVNIAITIGAFFTTSLIGRILGPFEFGNLSYAVAIGSIIAANIRFGMDMTLLRDLVHFKERSKDILVASIFIRFYIFIFCTLILFTLNEYQIVHISFAQYLILTSTVLLAFQLNSYYDFIGLLKESSIQNLLYKFIYFSIIWLCSFLFELNIKLIGNIMLITLLIYLFIHYYRVHVITILKEVKYPITDIFFLLKENYIVWLTTMFVLMSYSVNQIVIDNVLSTFDLGIFASCYLFVSAILMFYKQVARVSKPLMAEYTNKKTILNKRYIYLYFLSMVGFGVLFAIPFLFFAESMLLYTFGKEYIIGVPVLNYFSLFIFLKAIEIFITQYFQYSRDYKTLLYTNASFGISTIVLTIYLLPIYGTAGAAIALSAGLGISLSILILLHILHKKGDNYV
ncbi:hypothetical protein [Sulfurovum sp. TSL6]|uniref:hypothetical protein n=1 Tax=Sulfurovum sp. TSL6 TaxID=2826995 RepID=UPI001CC45343|nr:hypothetical protein [Sulfurovum sp. TSL6]